MNTATKHPNDSKFEHRQLDYMLTAWGDALRNGWEPQIGFAPNILSRFQPRKDAPPPELPDTELQRIHRAFSRYYDIHKNAAIAIWFCYVEPGSVERKLNKLRISGMDWTKSAYKRYLELGRQWMSGALTG